MSQVHALATEAANDPTLFDVPTRLSDRGTSPVRDSGLVEQFRWLTVGASPARLLDTIARYAGVQSSTASSILMAVIPMVLGTLGSVVRREGLDAAGLGRRLAAEHESVISAIPGSLSGLLPAAGGLTVDATRTGAPGIAAEDDGVYGSSDMTASSTGRFSPWPWITAAIVLAALWGTFAVFGRYRAADEGERAVGTSGAYLTRILPDGAELRVPANGAEAKLLEYVPSGAPLGNGIWIEFDRLSFEPGSATLRPDSLEQLAGIADIMKAYPAVHLKIGGYTDNAGDAVANLALSQERAACVMNELVSLGVPADRLEAKGYGEEHPVATNDTDEGREQNRRVAFQVTAH